MTGPFAGRYVKNYTDDDAYQSLDVDIAIYLKENNRAFDVRSTHTAILTVGNRQTDSLLSPRFLVCARFLATRWLATNSQFIGNLRIPGRDDLKSG